MLFTDLLTVKMFSKHNLFWNFKIEPCLNRVLVRKKTLLVSKSEDHCVSIQIWGSWKREYSKKIPQRFKIKKKHQSVFSSGQETMGSPIVCTLPFLLGGGGELNLKPNFQKGGLDRILTFRGGLLRKRGGDSFQAVGIFT